MVARTFVAAVLLFAFFSATAQAQDSAAPSVAPPGATTREFSDVEQQVRQILTTGTLERNAVMARLVERGNTDVVPALIQSLRFMGQDPWSISNALQALTGEDFATSWHDWVLWQEGYPEIKPFEGFAEYKAWVYSQIDPNFRLFLYVFDAEGGLVYSEVLNSQYGGTEMFVAVAPSEGDRPASLFVAEGPIVWRYTAKE